MTKTIKRLSSYRYLRGAVFAMIGPHRFYSPLLGARLASAGEEGVSFDEVRDTIKVLRQYGQYTVWQTELGEITTDAATERDHLTYLVREFRGESQYHHPHSHVRPNDVVLDTGANIGLFARAALRQGAARILCLEPVPTTFAALQKNLSAGIAAGTVTALNTGVWDRHETLTFHVNPAHPGNSSLLSPQTDRGAYDLRIPVDLIDSIVESAGIDRVDFIKMDIEGAEVKALAGAKRALSFKPRLAIGVEHTADRLQNAANVRDLVLSINSKYRCEAGPYSVIPGHRLAPEVLFFW